jgi:RimJ/RimL family protein N-acetyltransferase
MSAHVLTLRPLSESAATEIEHWFDHPEVRHRLGGRPWIHRAVHLLDAPVGEMFRGRKVLRAHGWIADDADGTPVANIGGDVYDRFDSARVVSMGLGYVVDPSRWRTGLGRAAIETVLRHPAVRDVALFFCGIDADNHASRRCAESAGFHLTDPVPDHEDTLYYRRDVT